MKEPIAAAVAVTVALTGCAAKQDARLSSVEACEKIPASSQPTMAAGPDPVRCSSDGTGGAEVSPAPGPAASQSEFEKAMTGLGIVLLAGAVVVALILLPLALHH
jgi:hypothetical protein